MPDFSSQGNRRVRCDGFNARQYVATKQMCHHLPHLHGMDLH